MPMFQYPSGPEQGSPPSPNGPGGSPPQPFRISPAQRLARKISEESIRTELCEGPVPDSPLSQSSLEQSDQAAATTTSDRAELIERLKRGESPTWIPHRRVSPLPGRMAAMLHGQPLTNDQVQLESFFQQDGPLSPGRNRGCSPSPLDSRPSLLPPATIMTKHDGPPVSPADGEEQRQQDGLDIERPRSALHSGDFTQNNNGSPDAHRPTQGLLRDLQQPRQADWERRWGAEPTSQPHFRPATSPPRSGAIDISIRTPLPKSSELYSPTREPSTNRGSGPSSLSSSFSSCFAYRHPTSPLVQSESNDDLDLRLPLSSIDLGSGRNPRRHTLSARDYPSPSLQQSQSIGLRRETTFPYQAHQPRRSLASNPSWLATAPGDTSPGSPTSFLRSRPLSLGSDASPLQHASMVGSYEESILRGRMSTTPSKPLDFVAQIGVLGIGDCKSSLRCPPHVTLAFSAVFYSYSSTSHGRSATEEGPSPYVGMIDLENGLKDQSGDDRAKRKVQSRNLARRTRQEADEDVIMVGNSPEETKHFGLLNGTSTDSRKTAKSKRQPSSPRAPPGGSYRIPPKGQLQIIIKNQNKTAVKLFLVPYDLNGMEPGTKTFIRQRIFSKADTDTAPSTSSESSKTANTTSQGTLAAARPILRYLIHLNICCPSKGRFYLYKSVRVVFASRVPDGKEKLQNEITLPEPRFSAYKSVRVMQPALSSYPVATNTSGPGALLAADKAFRRRSAGYMFGGGPRVNGLLDGISLSLSGGMAAAQNLPVEPSASPAPRTRLDSITSEGAEPTSDGRTASSTSQASIPPSPGVLGNGSTGRRDRAASGTDPDTQTQYNKLNKGDVGYGGNAFLLQVAHGQLATRGATEGLLSQRLRSLGVQEEDELAGDWV